MLPYRLAFLVLINFLILLSSPVRALPLRVRQNAPTTLQTVHTTQTIAGPLTETCVITLTPITDKDGNPAVEEVKQCTLGYARSGSDDGGGVSSTVVPSGSSESATATSTSTSTPPSTSTLTIPSSSDPSSSPTSASETVTLASSSTSVTTTATSVSVTSLSSGVSTPAGSSATSATASQSGLIVHGVSTVSGTPTQTGSTTASSPAASSTTPTTTPPANQETAASGTTAPDNTSASSTDPAASAAAASESAEPFQLPGKKLSVLPIGLGVFAGISVIALIVVGLVTYERTKYRKAFRARKLAESGSAMGYGGMAQRS
ncbi:hypothetical protein BDZ94DRAFT_1255135 [Collybia nuda]|uniref:Uncharacterized protein n=1 Tax=Collybia nuda TaxID=64659 RepID=A0A9P5YAX2_9AGAR|nr:hypothetical protein BDZ94DRAFT_1255135 [Collybia nuda]